MRSRAHKLSIEQDLEKCAHAARRALTRTKEDRDKFLHVMRRFVLAVDSARLEVDPGVSAGVRQATDAFKQHYDALRAKLDGLVERTSVDLAAAYADIERDADFVTLMLFGRTRAGKSTTMEALTGGDGATIGVGRQHTTRGVRAYFFPPSPNGMPAGPALRIVDTPGIEGFAGDELTAMAEEFVERSDHILFLLTDDKATSSELDRFGLIRTQGKSVTVLLNVKAADEDLDLLITTPHYIFKPGELDGHMRRITSYLKRHFEMAVPRVLPFHARAAWLGRSKAELPDGIHDRALLLHRSRFQEVEQCIRELIHNEALPARIRAPRDLLSSYIWPLKDELRPFAGQFRQLMDNIDQLARRLEGGAERARRRVAARFPLLRARFQAASDAIPGAVDTVIAAKGRGAELHAQWQQLLEQHGLTDATTWFVEAGQRDFEAELAEEVRAGNVDYEFAQADDLDSLLGEYHEADKRGQRNKYVRAGLRAGAGTGAAALTTWAIANWWNPTGWAAAAAAALVVAAGIAGEAGARKATDEWERSSKYDLYEKRGEIIAKLRDRVWAADYRAVRARCGTWLDETKALHLNTAREVARPIQFSAEKLWKATVACLGELDDVANRANVGLVEDVFAAIIPECNDGSILLESIARAPGYRTKVVVSAVGGSGVNAIASCIGRQGVRVRQLCAALGDKQVDLVDAHAPLELQVLQALGIARLSRPTVAFDKQGGQTCARVRVSERRQVRAALGSRGTNVRLSAQLLGIQIVIEGSEL